MRYRQRDTGVVVSVRDGKPMGREWEPLESASGSETCPDCGFVAKSSAGLSAHTRKHE